jgi:hypothetical protein
VVRPPAFAWLIALAACQPSEPPRSAPKPASTRAPDPAPRAAPPEPEAVVAPPPPGELELSALTQYPKLPRVRLLRRTAPRWTPEGPKLAARPEGPWPFGPADVPLVERRAGSVRISVWSPGMEQQAVLLLWVDAELEPLLTRAVRLPTSTPAARGFWSWDRGRPWR